MSSCETKPDYWTGQWCLVLRIREARPARRCRSGLFAKWRAADGDSAAYQYATIYAQWGNRAKALEWLETALRWRDFGLVTLKSDPLLDPLRKESRFQAIERALKFPN